MKHVTKDTLKDSLFALFLFMKHKLRVYLIYLCSLLLVIGSVSVFIFFIGFTTGAAVNTTYIDSCETRFNKPKTYLTTLMYPALLGMTAGCELNEPRFNLTEEEKSLRLVK